MIASICVVVAEHAVQCRACPRALLAVAAAAVVHASALQVSFALEVASCMSLLIDFCLFFCTIHQRLMMASGIACIVLCCLMRITFLPDVCTHLSSLSFKCRVWRQRGIQLRWERGSECEQPVCCLCSGQIQGLCRECCLCVLYGRDVSGFGGPDELQVSVVGQYRFCMLPSFQPAVCIFCLASLSL
jgi:hypothetical protein